MLLYTQYFYLFQVAGMVLLVAMIGAIVLTLRRAPACAARRSRARSTARRTMRSSRSRRADAGAASA